MVGVKGEYSKHAEVTVPSLDDWEKQWKKNPQGIVKPAVEQRIMEHDKTDSERPGRVLASKAIFEC